MQVVKPDCGEGKKGELAAMLRYMWSLTSYLPHTQWLSIVSLDSLSSSIELPPELLVRRVVGVILVLPLLLLLLPRRGSTWLYP